MDHKDLCEHTRIHLIAAAVGLQQCTKTATNVIHIPGGDRVIAIGTPAEVRVLLEAQVGGYQAGAQAGEAITLYRPSNGTEGEGFMSRHCYQCKHDDGGIGERVCEIIGNTMIYNVDEPEYPTEWRYGADGRPTCTKFEMDNAQAGADQLDSEGGHHD